MRAISKYLEPKSLAEYRAKIGFARLRVPEAKSIFEDLPGKDDLRSSLVAEQRGLCCYCLCRIRPDLDSMKIEHWHSQSNHPQERLDYSNLLAACKGGEGTKNHQHCDTSRGSQNISRNPANPQHVVDSLIRFRDHDGMISSDDPHFDDELNRVLNLNQPFLMERRKEVLEGFIEALGKARRLGSADWVRFLADWNGDSHSAELRPFCQVVVYWLQKKVRRANS